VLTDIEDGDGGDVLGGAGGWRTAERSGFGLCDAAGAPAKALRALGGVRLWIGCEKPSGSDLDGPIDRQGVRLSIVRWVVPTSSSPLLGLRRRISRPRSRCTSGSDAVDRDEVAAIVASQGLPLV